jgi:hypothetical protein
MTLRPEIFFSGLYYGYGARFNNNLYFALTLLPYVICSAIINTVILFFQKNFVFLKLRLFYWIWFGLLIILSFVFTKIIVFDAYFDFLPVILTLPLIYLNIRSLKSVLNQSKN